MISLRNAKRVTAFGLCIFFVVCYESCEKMAGYSVGDSSESSSGPIGNPTSTPTPTPSQSLRVPPPTPTPTSTGGVSCSSTPLPGQMGSPCDPWNVDVSQASLDPNSANIIAWMIANGGASDNYWGNLGKLFVELEFTVLPADSSTPMAPFQEDSGYYTPDCDSLTQFPTPTGGAIQSSNNYTCNTSGDCHLLVYNSTTNVLYESYKTTMVSGAITSACGVMWDMSPTFTYGATLRDNPVSNVGSGDHCTSVDAGGFPISAFLFSPDDIVSGSINHAVRLTLPNNMMQAGVYVRPAVHKGGPSAAAPAPPYGTRFRLKSMFDTSKFSAGGKVVAAALQKYGMVIADGGDHCIDADIDTYTTHKWTDSDVNMTAINNDINTLTPDDFDVVYGSAAIVETYDCKRVPLSN